MAKALAAIQVSNEGVRLVGEVIDNLTTVVKNGSELVTAVEELASKVVTAVDKALAYSQQERDKAIKHNYQKRTVLLDLLLVAESVSGFLHIINNFLIYCQNKGMARAREGLGQTPPNLQPLHDVIKLLQKTMKQAKDKHSELHTNCGIARSKCKEDAQECEGMETKSQKKKRATKGIGGSTAAGAAVAGVIGTAGAIATGGVLIAVIAGPLTFGVGVVVGLGITATAAGVAGTAGAVGAGVATHYIAKDYEEDEARFRKLCQEYKSLLSLAEAMELGMARIDITLENIATQINNVKDSAKMKNIDLIEDSLDCLIRACTDSYHTVSRCKEQVLSKMAELKRELDE